MTDKKEFLKKEFTKLLAGLQSGQKGKWGKMNAQQMVEHMAEYVRIASGKELYESQYPQEIIERSYAFMMSEKPFKENTPNKLLPDEPRMVHHVLMSQAISELQSEINDFFSIYESNPGLRNMSPFFGNLNFEEQVQLLHKHAVHHARQFGLVE